MPVLPYFKEVSNKVALEIGYGGGRLLAEAAKSFKKVIGVDIHNNGSIVKKTLQDQNINNIELIQNEGNNIPVKEDSIDLVYSFIVLQHIEKISNFHAYLSDTYLVLKKGGIAILFFGRLSTRSTLSKSKFWYKMDLFLENFHPTGYEEIVTEVNNVNLKISLKYAKKAAFKLGFKILESGASRKLPDFEKFGGQYFMMLQK